MQQSPTHPLMTVAAARVVLALDRLHRPAPEDSRPGERWPNLAAIAAAAELSAGATSAALRELDGLRMVTTPRRGALRSEGVSLTTVAGRRVKEAAAAIIAGADTASYLDAVSPSDPPAAA